MASAVQGRGRPIPNVPRALTEYEETFIEVFVATGDVTRAAEETGISVRAGQLFLERPFVKKYIAQIRGYKPIEEMDCQAVLSEMLTVVRDAAASQKFMPAIAGYKILLDHFKQSKIAASEKVIDLESEYQDIKRRLTEG